MLTLIYIGTSSEKTVSNFDLEAKLEHALDELNSRLNLDTNSIGNFWFLDWAGWT